MVNRAIQCERTQNIGNPLLPFHPFFPFHCPYLSFLQKKKRGAFGLSFFFLSCCIIEVWEKKKQKIGFSSPFSFLGGSFAFVRSSTYRRNLSWHFYFPNQVLCCKHTKFPFCVSHVVRWPMVTTAVQSQSIKFCRQFDSQLFGGLSLNSFFCRLSRERSGYRTHTQHVDKSNRCG